MDPASLTAVYRRNRPDSERTGSAGTGSGRTGSARSSPVAAAAVAAAAEESSSASHPAWHPGRTLAEAHTCCSERPSAAVTAGTAEGHGREATGSRRTHWRQEGWVCRTFEHTAVAAAVAVVAAGAAAGGSTAAARPAAAGTAAAGAG